MEWLNYHHLLYFWVVAREGSVAKASEELRLAQPTISAGRTYVPNRYRVQLNPADYRAVAAQRSLWEREIAEFIIGICQERGYTLVNRPIVTITESAETPRRGIAIVATLPRSSV